MQCGLFSVFDPSVLDGGELKWISGTLVVFFFYQYFLSAVGGVKSSIISSLFSSICQALPEGRKGFLPLFTLGVLILLFGCVGLIPYTFSVTSHLCLCLSLSLSMWFSSFLLGFLFTYKEKVSHLLPMGSPPALWPFLVLVESVSLVIRPFTLSIRLMANVMAGHLMLSLMGGGISSLYLSLPTISVSAFFLGFEVCVMMVQTYVFVSLLSLYWGE